MVAGRYRGIFGCKNARVHRIARPSGFHILNFEGRNWTPGFASLLLNPFRAEQDARRNRQLRHKPLAFSLVSAAEEIVLRAAGYPTLSL